MTIAPDVPALKFDTPAEAITALREHGLRLSTARRLVLEALFAADGPVAAAYLADTLAIDESSVYRNLEVLESHGLIRHVHLGHGPGLYVLLGGDDVEYLYCERCAKVTPVAPDRLRPVHEWLRQHFGYEARFSHFAIVGHCADCAAQPKSPSGSDGNVESAGTGSHDQRRPTELGVGEAKRVTHDHAHSHGEYVHSHPHTHARHEHD